MPKFDDFDLDVNFKTTSSEIEPQIATSAALCTPGTCAKKCDPTAWYCSNTCITKTCITCV